jgi:hypothetical protein
MSTLSALSTYRIDGTKQQKLNNTYFGFNIIQNKNLSATTTTFNNSGAFLATSTVGYVVSPVTTSNLVVSKTQDASTYIDGSTPLLSQTSAFALAPTANSQIDTSVSMNLTPGGNDILRFVVKSKTAGATFNLILSSDTGFVNRLTYTITTGTVADANGDFSAMLVTDASVGVITGTPVLASIIRARIIAVNSTATSFHTPVQLDTANNISRFIGSKLSWVACCLEDFGFEWTKDTVDLTCGGTVIGSKFDKEEITVNFKVAEESADLMGMAGGVLPEQKSVVIPKNFSGFGKDNTDRFPTAAGTGLGAHSTIQLDIGAVVVSIVDIKNCASLKSIPYSASVLTNANQIIGTGQYMYNPATGIVYLNSTNVTTLYSIHTNQTVTAQVNEFTPATLGYRGSLTLVEQNSTGDRTAFVIFKKVQLNFPSISLGDEGRELEFEMKAFLESKGDFVIGYVI